MMGIEAYLLAPALQTIIAQRLVRKVCPTCSSLRNANDQENSFILKYLSTIAEVRSDVRLNYTGQIVTVG